MRWGPDMICDINCVCCWNSNRKKSAPRLSSHVLGLAHTLYKPPGYSPEAQFHSRLSLPPPPRHDLRLSHQQSHAAMWCTSMDVWCVLCSHLSRSLTDLPEKAAGNFVRRQASSGAQCTNPRAAEQTGGFKAEQGKSETKADKTGNTEVSRQTNSDVSYALRS